MIWAASLNKLTNSTRVFTLLKAESIGEQNASLLLLQRLTTTLQLQEIKVMYLQSTQHSDKDDYFLIFSQKRLSAIKVFTDQEQNYR